MKVRTPSYVKVNLAKVLDAALAGQPTVIFRKGRLAILKEYDPRTDSYSRLEAALEEGGGLEHEPTPAEQKMILRVSRRK